MAGSIAPPSLELKFNAALFSEDLVWPKGRFNVNYEIALGRQRGKILVTLLG
jgi:hypothetical protein